jgi:hypothetical protein
MVSRQVLKELFQKLKELQEIQQRLETIAKQIRKESAPRK